MINEQVTLHCAYQTPPVLVIAHGLNIFWGKSVFLHQSSAQILKLGGLGIASTPTLEPFIPTRLVCLAVFVIFSAGAFLALLALPPPKR